MLSLQCVVFLLLQFFILGCFGAIRYEVHSPATANPEDDTIDAYVADLSFTSSWYDQQPPIARSPNPVACPIPKTDITPSFGIAYNSFEAQTAIADCWIMEAHRQAGNLDVDYLRANGASIVHGSGVSELLIASISALALRFPKALGRPVITMQSAPYYAVMRTVSLSPVLQGLVEWVEPSDVVKRKVAGRPLIVVAVLPSNPLGVMNGGFLSECVTVNSTNSAATLNCFGSPTYVISDHSYLWPCLVPEQNRNTLANGREFNWPIRPIHSSIQLFGLSKFSGHSALRFGWAWVRDSQIAAGMRRSLWERGSTLSAVSVLQASLVLATTVTGTTFHHWCEMELNSRWSKLEALTAFGVGPHSSSCYRLHSTRGFSVAFIECPTGKSCANQLRDVGIIATPGESFGYNSSFARMNVGGTSEAFLKLVGRLGTLPAKYCPS